MKVASSARATLLLLTLLCGWIAPCAAQNGTEQQSRTDRDYVRWLEEHSMLFQARQQARRVSGRGLQWQHPYGEPRPRDAVRLASVWLLDYPGSVITSRGRSVIETWGEPELWEALEHIGIELLHTGPIKQAGGVRGRRFTPTIDGWFDPISLEIDPDIGTDREYQRMARVAEEHGGSIAGDLVPLHTGIGPDFRLATRGYKDYPGMYTMVEIRQLDWNLLPKVEGPWATAVIPKEDAEELFNKGYLPGLINSNDATPKARELSGWSATGEVPGVDGKIRRWAFLHYFKKEQPALNWLDPSFAAQRAVTGDIVKTMHTLGARVMRLDAVPFLGIEPKPDDPLSEHFKHPLSVQGTNSLAFMIRKLGGYSFHELNVPLRELKAFTEHGPDLAYDFFTRAQCLHALLIEDATLLRQAFQFVLDAGVQPVSLVHDLQNHDEITYQLVELDGRKDETFEIDGRRATGRELREQMLSEMREKASGDRAPHNKLYRVEKDGLATTFAGFVAAALEIRDPYRATRQEVERIRQGHLLLAAANAMQPGVFSLSSWDLVGALPIPEESVKDRIDDGDYRWVNRGGVDLMGFDPKAKESAFGLQRAEALYGSLPEQFDDPDSFAEQLRSMLKARRTYRIAEGTLLAVPPVENRSACILVMESPKSAIVVTAINFSQRSIRENIDLSEMDAFIKAPHAGKLVDVINHEELGELPESGKMSIDLPELTARTIVIAADDER